MAGPVLTIEGIIISTAVASAVALFICALRQWALRYRTNTAAATIADVGLYCALVCHWVIVGLFSVDYAREIKIRRKVQEELAVTLLVVTRPFLLRDLSAYLFYITEIWCLKLAYLGIYWPLRQHLSHRNNILYIGVCIYTSVGYIATIGATLFRCWPISRNGDFYAQNQCIALLKISSYGVITTFHISSDLLILFLGLKIIYGLAPSPAKRRALLHVAGLGFMSIVMGAVRSGTIIEAVHHQEDRFLKRIHFVNAIATFEVMLAYLAFCIPSLRRLSCRVRVSIAGKSLGSDSTGRSREIPPSGTIGGSGRANRVNLGDTDVLELTVQERTDSNTFLTAADKHWDEENQRI